jgi:hydrogenase nickel incorporation protein HypA/HybF
VHELSLAGAIVRTVAAHADGRRVTAVEVKVGHLRQVVPSALEFAFELVAQGTEVEGATLELEDVPARVACSTCAGEHDVTAFPLACRACGSLDVVVVGGEELSIESLELEDDPAAVGGR